jgi:uncharacterized protein YbjT (DUF2867 family)
MAGDGPVVVVGGTGMLGGQVVTALLSRGKRVRALVRPVSDAARLERAGVEIARGDMMDPASLLRAMDGADAVVTTAAGYTRHSKGDTAEIDRTGNSNLADAASRAGVRRFVLTSILTCDQTPQVPHFWHKKLAEDRLEVLGVPFVSLRPGAFLDQITRMGDPFAKRRLMSFGSPTMPLTYVLTSDVAGYLADAVDAPGVDGQRIDIGWDDQHCYGGGGPVQSDGQGLGRDDALVPDRPVHRRSDSPARGVRPGAHRGGRHLQACPQPRTHCHRLVPELNETTPSRSTIASAQRADRRRDPGRAGRMQ